MLERWDFTCLVARWIVNNSGFVEIYISKLVVTQDTFPFEIESFDSVNISSNITTSDKLNQLHGRSGSDLTTIKDVF